MLSVVIATQESERELLRTLAALVPGASAGLVREVLIADAGSRDGTAGVADAAGCELMVSAGMRGARLKAAAEKARAPWLLFLQPGIVPDLTWVDETRRFMAEAELHDRDGRRAAVFRPGLGTSRPLWVEALSLLRRALGTRSNADQGLLIGKNLYQEVGGHRVDAAEPERDLARRLGRGRIATLRSGAVVTAHRPVIT
ncbi:MAG TPA: glycosyltransferase [Xanthobacteraceae bacterium]|nr:glycosyltransferase [Xanthobacteraceae bacterium]